MRCPRWPRRPAMREIIEGIHAEVPGLMIVVRLSVFDTVPYRRGPHGTGEPDPGDTSGFGFGVLGADGMSLTAPDRLNSKVWLLLALLGALLCLIGWYRAVT